MVVVTAIVVAVVGLARRHDGPVQFQRRLAAALVHTVIATVR